MSKILIVDDEPHIRLLLEQTLEELEHDGVEILVSDNGSEALEIIKQERPDIVYLDIMMPEMNGYDVCHAVKKELRINGVYIAMLTAKGQKFDKNKGFACGADDYITKPFDPDDIIRKTEEVLANKIQNSVSSENTITVQEPFNGNIADMMQKLKPEFQETVRLFIEFLHQRQTKEDV
ncbi:MAG: response regulator [Candidatus Magnetoovum sp. WYHC-5]|nr:response regulator [Candidatus Magnetoovum sp. WYHC-5]